MFVFDYIIHIRKCYNTSYFPIHHVCETTTCVLVYGGNVEWKITSLLYHSSVRQAFNNAAYVASKTKGGKKGEAKSRKINTMLEQRDF